MSEFFAMPEVRNLVAKTVLIAVLLLPAPFLGMWGWRYGKSGRTHPLGFAWRTFVAVAAGSWTLGVWAGHGVGFIPLPAVVCGALLRTERSFGCMPAVWITPVICLIVFCGAAIVAEQRLRRLGSGSV